MRVQRELNLNKIKLFVSSEHVKMILRDFFIKIETISPIKY